MQISTHVEGVQAVHVRALTPAREARRYTSPGSRAVIGERRARCTALRHRRATGLPAWDTGAILLQCYR